MTDRKQANSTNKEVAMATKDNKVTTESGIYKLLAPRVEVRHIEAFGLFLAIVFVSLFALLLGWASYISN